MRIAKFFTEEDKTRWDRFLKEYIPTLTDNKKKLNAIKAWVQDFYKNNFAAFVDLLGYRDLGAFHKEQLKKLESHRFLESQPVRNLWLWSRGHFKTSIITVAHSLWLIVNNLNIRLLIGSFTLDISKKIFDEIRKHFISNEEFRYYFEEFCPKANKEGKIEFGTTEELTIPNRIKILKEPTIKCAGVGTNLTTLHFDWMKIDDIVTETSTTNETQIQASKDYYGSLRQLFDNPEIPREDVIGTIYHFNDLHNAVLLKSSEFNKSIIPARNENNEVVFSERFSNEGLNKILNDPSIGPYIFNCQYLLNPIDPSKRKFKDEWVKFYDLAPEGLSEYLLCDPASSKKKTSDYTVIERWGVDSEMNFYLLDGVRDKLGANERVELYISLAKQAQRLKGAKYEVIGGRHGDLENIYIKFIENKFSITPKETKATTASKIDRIEQRLAGQFHAGKIYLPRSLKKTYKYNGKIYDFVQEYLLEYRQFPFSEHDDILDCHSQLFDGEYIEKGKPSVKNEPKEDEFEWWRQRAIEAKKPKRLRYIFGNRGRFPSIPASIAYR